MSAKRPRDAEIDLDNTRWVPTPTPVFVAPAVSASAEPHPGLTERHQQELRDYGYTIVEDVIDADKCRAALDQLWQFVVQLSGGKVRRGDPSTYTPAIWPPYTHHILKGYGIGQLEALWAMRQDPVILGLFSTYWGVPAEELLCSFDGGCLSPGRREHVTKNSTAAAALDLSPILRKLDEPNVRGELTELDYEATRGWTHVDESPCQPSTRCIQGLVNLVDSRADGCGGTIVYPRAHRCIRKLMAAFAMDKNKKNFIKLTAPMLRALAADARSFFEDDDPLHDAPEPVPIVGVRIGLRAGAMLLWRSNLPHQGVEPGDEDRYCPTDSAKLYVCLAPRSWATPEQIAARKLLFAKGATTSHWPQIAKENSKPRIYSRDRQHPAGDVSALLITKPEQLQPIGRKLVGY
jgi:hypothetical protein